MTDRLLPRKICSVTDTTNTSLTQIQVCTIFFMCVNFLLSNAEQKTLTNTKYVLKFYLYSKNNFTTQVNTAWHRTVSNLIHLLHACAHHLKEHKRLQSILLFCSMYWTVSCSDYVYSLLWTTHQNSFILLFYAHACKRYTDVFLSFSPHSLFNSKFAIFMINLLTFIWQKHILLRIVS